MCVPGLNQTAVDTNRLVTSSGLIANSCIYIAYKDWLFKLDFLKMRIYFLNLILNGSWCEVCIF
jgi:hypothetical protein